VSPILRLALLCRIRREDPGEAGAQRVDVERLEWPAKLEHPGHHGRALQDRQAPKGCCRWIEAQGSQEGQEIAVATCGGWCSSCSPLDQTARTGNSCNRRGKPSVPDRLRRDTWPPSIGLGGGLAPESAAVFIGMRITSARGCAVHVLPDQATQSRDRAVRRLPQLASWPRSGGG
jgi:hypothetical protein